VVAPEAEIEIIGIPPGEKLHEVLISEDEARNTIEMPEMYVVQPVQAFWFGRSWESAGSPLPEGFKFGSNTNARWLTMEQLSAITGPLEAGMQKEGNA